MQKTSECIALYIRIEVKYSREIVGKHAQISMIYIQQEVSSTEHHLQLSGKF